MQTDSIYFESLNQVDAWVAEHGEDDLNLANSMGRFRGSTTEGLVHEWRMRSIVKRQDMDDARRARDANVDRELRIREVAAAEDAATAAASSARWAMFAVVISTAALLFSAWPYIK